MDELKVNDGMGRWICKGGNRVQCGSECRRAIEQKSQAGKRQKLKGREIREKKQRATDRQQEQATQVRETEPDMHKYVLQRISMRLKHLRLNRVLHATNTHTHTRLQLAIRNTPQGKSTIDLSALILVDK